MIKNTSMIQVQSVVNFMGCLGYILDRDRKNGSFRNEGQKSRVANLYISFDTASKLHNSSMESWAVIENTAVSRDVHLETGFSPTSVVLAYASKLVQKSKVRFDRHGKLLLDEGANLVRAVSPLITAIIAEE